MRPLSRLPLRELAILALAASIGGCSTTGSDEPLATSSLAPRPQEGLRQDPPRYNTAESESPKPYTQPYHQPPAYQPRPRQFAQQEPSYNPSYTQQPSPAQRYAAPAPPPQQWQQYPQHTAADQTWQKRNYYGQPAQAQIQTGSLARPSIPPYAAPMTTGSLGQTATTIQVREGDTLYGLSRRTGVPVAELVAANRLSGDRIEVGQKLVIPSRIQR